MDVTAIEVHSAFDEVEDNFHRALDESLNPRGPDSLLDLVASLNLSRGTKAVDVGCGRGEHTLELASRFGFDVLGIDPVARYEAAAAQELTDGSARFSVGTAESIPLESSSFD